jgi:hypothetical protein
MTDHGLSKVTPMRFPWPDHPARPANAFRHQGELRRDSDRADVQCRAGVRNVFDRAGDDATPEFDPGAFQHAMPGCNPMFVSHSFNLKKIPENIQPKIDDQWYFSSRL